MRSAKVAILGLVFAIGALVLGGCGDLGALFTSTNYDYVYAYTAITYYGPESWGSAPATIKMWEKLYTGNADSQEDINTWLGDNAGTYEGGTDGDNGIHSYLFAAGLAHFADASPDWESYDSGQTCNGQSCFVQGLSDIGTALNNHHPPALKVYGSLYGLVNQWGASRQCNILGCQPSVDFFYLQVPASGHGANLIITANDMPTVWVDANSNVSEVFFLDNSSYMSTGSGDFSSAADLATTYYGDPDPPTPTYSNEEAGGGDGGAPPILELSRLPLGSSASASRRMSRAASVNRLLVPNPKNENEILTDFVAAVKRIHLDRQRELASATLADKKWALSSVVPVRSLDSRPDYYLLSFVDRMTKKVVMQATMSVGGLLLAVRKVDVDEPPQAVTSPEAAASILTRTFGANSARPELAFGSNQFGLTEFDPFYIRPNGVGKALVVTPGGRTYAMNVKPVARTGEPSMNGDRNQMRLLSGRADAAKKH